jgi:hypothetical protein
MRFRRRQVRVIARRCLACVSFALCASAWPVLAQPSEAGSAPVGPSPAPAPSGTELVSTPLAEALSGQAKADYDAGRILFGDDDFAGAAVKFQRAYERSHDVRLLWNMAVCEKNLRHYARVLRLLQPYQREGDALMSPARRSEVADVVATVRLLISTVRITVRPDGADVFLDDVPAGKTPLSDPLWVDLGMRRIRVSKPGFKDYVIAQNFAGASELTFDVSLQPEVHQGQLVISAGTGDSISVDGKVVAQGQWQGTLPSGEHSVRIHAAGMRPYAKDLVIEDDAKRSLFVTLEPEKSAGLSPLVWVGAGILVAGGLAAGGYLLLRPAPTAPTQVGTWDPGTVSLQ